MLLDTFLARTYLVTSASVGLDGKVWWPDPMPKAPDSQTRAREPVKVGLLPDPRDVPGRPSIPDGRPRYGG